MDESASEALCTEVAEAGRKALKDAFENWDFTEKVEAAYKRYMQKLLANDDIGPWYVSTVDRADAPIISFSILDENVEEIISHEDSLFSIFDRQFDDCERSQADIILALEHTVSRLKRSFSERFGVAFDVVEIDKHCRANNPRASYEPWTPSDPR